MEGNWTENGGKKNIPNKEKLKVYKRKRIVEPFKEICLFSGMDVKKWIFKRRREVRKEERRKGREKRIQWMDIKIQRERNV